ncbi:hypothetical protein [Sporomusa aerivorans]|uniref:hypothetical protein n=1 Tax=Sporomusa aerivorans TaxID=204936 RepID=UPI00352ACDC7
MHCTLDHFFTLYALLNYYYPSNVAYTMKASELAYECQIDSEAADTKFRNKIIKLNGNVRGTGQYPGSNRICVFFQPEEAISILVTFPEEKWSKLRKIKEGDFIELQARYRGMPRPDKENILIIQLDAINE